MAAVFCLTSSGRSARSSLYSRQAVVSSFWCHRLERPAISMSHLRRHSRFEDSDSRPFWFPVPTKTLFYVTVTNHRYCLDTCGPCNNQHYLGHVKVFMMMMMMMMNCKHELQAPPLIPVQISCTVSRWSHMILFMSPEQQLHWRSSSRWTRSCDTIWKYCHTLASSRLSRRSQLRSSFCRGTLFQV